MNNQNKNNSIIFLTTLSVYLGLVLVGSPTVLAQAATQTIEKSVSRNYLPCNNFSAQSENLFSKGFFGNSVSEILKNLQELSSDKSLSYHPFVDLFRVDYEIQSVSGSINKIFVKDGNFPESNSLTRGFYAVLNNNVIDLVSQLPDKEFRITNFESSVKEDANLQKTKFELTQSAFTAQISFEAISVEKANHFTELFNETFAIGICRSNSQKVIYENTKASNEKNQVFIVTRLPRGSLDELLKQDAKANGK